MKKKIKKILLLPIVGIGVTTLSAPVVFALQNQTVLAYEVGSGTTGVVSSGGTYKYYVKGVFQKDFTGVAFSKDGRWLFIKNGVFDNSFSGIAKSTKGNWIYVKNGVYDPGFTGIAKSTKGNWLYVKNGRYNANFTGIALSTKGNWLFVKNGRYNTGFTGIALSTKGNWLFVKNGRYNTSFTGVALSTKGNWIFVKNGRYDTSFSGVALSTKGNWIYVKNGRYNSGYTGVATSTKGNLIYISKGKYDSSFTGETTRVGTSIKCYVEKGRWIRDIIDEDGWITIDGKKYYYKNSEAQKGLQKIENVWYEFDKSTGVYTGRSGENLYLGSFFKDKSDQMTRYYITFDGKYMSNVTNIGTKWQEIYRIVNNDPKTLVSRTRDSNVFCKDGKFYTFITAYSNNNSDSTKPYDFAIVETTDFKTFNWRTPDTYSGNTGMRWAPEHFIDDDGRMYVFYAAAPSEENKKKQIYMTECLNYVDNPLAMGSTRYSFSSPVKVNFNGIPSGLSSDNMIDANVIKKDGIYYMIVKREYDSTNKVQASLMVFKSTDLTNWNYYYNLKVSDVFPKNESSNTDYRAAEGPCITEINGVYYLYVDLYDTQNYNTTDPSILNSLTYENNNQYMGIHYATSTDLKNWKYGGKITTSSGDSCRHGSVLKISDEQSERVIQTVFNGGMIEIPDPVTLSYTGERQTFYDCTDSAYDSEKKLWVFSAPFYYVYTKEPKDARDYEVTLVLKDKNTNRWSDGTTEDKVLTCSIKK